MEQIMDNLFTYAFGLTTTYQLMDLLATTLVLVIATPLLEWDNGTLFTYTKDHKEEYCRSSQLDIGFLCNVWQKVDFIWYYEDVVTKRPVHWVFYTGRSIHVMTFEVGAVLEDAKWQAPVYYFQDKGTESEHQVDVGYLGPHLHDTFKGSMPL